LNKRGENVMIDILSLGFGELYLICLKFIPAFMLASLTWSIAIGVVVAILAIIFSNIKGKKEA